MMREIPFSSEILFGLNGADVDGMDGVLFPSSVRFRGSVWGGTGHGLLVA